ncbi:hypothetical protein EH223_02705 [candidate division KSB1 bacterium]|nr:hypothetical protein [candidate division KSB1 bacterium]RQW06307.1 MAG: hypothetical protein EH223_02705 [candidate division KSB1 bacterium]
MLKRYMILFYFLCLGFWADKNYAQIPKWAEDQLTLRSIIQESIRETQKWQHEDGSIYPSYLNLWKWDDETEIFYFWLTYYYLTGDESVYQSVKGIAFTYIRRAEENDLFEHGYYRDKFFDTEHTLEGLIILANLAWARPDDREVVNALYDVVEHAANLVPDYHFWFNEETSLMRSVRPGTRAIDKNNVYAVDWVFNLQFVKMALAAYHANNDKRLLEWSKKYLYGWIEIMEKNERENGYYVLPASVDPYTKQIGPYSGVWWHSEFEPGWGWQEAGNNAFRDMRGAFIDYYRMTGDQQPLKALKKHIKTLFDNGDSYHPAHTFDGTRWIPDDDKITVWSAVQVSLFDGESDADFDDFIGRWYKSLQYPDSEFHLWTYRREGGEDKINLINGRSIYDAQKHLDEIKALSVLPEEPDDFPIIGGRWGLTLVPFGGISAHRGEMPWKEILYYKADKSMGLDDGLAALVESVNDSIKTFYVANTTAQTRTLWAQSGYIREPIARVTVDGLPNLNIENNLVKLTVPPGKTIRVTVSRTAEIDTTPPAIVQGLKIIADE